MKKYYVLALLLVGVLALVGCNKQEPIEVLKPVVVLEEKPVEAVEECESIEIPAYRGDFDISMYPVFNLQNYSKAIITARFTENFVNNYRYEDSDKFFFALKVFVGNHTDNGGYYNTLRTRTQSVANWDYLTGAVLAYQLKEGFTWEIPLQEDIYLANHEFVEGKQFIKTNLSNYFEGETKIGAYLSSVKELGGWELADISIKLCK